MKKCYENDIPSYASAGDTAHYDGYLWRCYQFSKDIPDAIKWRRIRKIKKEKIK